MSPGLNLHVYPSVMLNESRIMRLSDSLQKSGVFRETHLVGSAMEGLQPNVDMGDGRRIVRVGRVASKTSGLARFRSALAWHLGVYRSYRARDVSMINAHSIWVLPVGWLLARRTRATLTYSTHELETETPTMKGLKRVTAKAIERALIRRCDLVSCVNDSIAIWYATNYSIPKPFVVRNIPVGVEGDGGVDLRSMLRIPPSALVFIHTGRLAAGRNIEVILRTFSDRATEGHVVFLGDGPLRPQVVHSAERCKRIHWLAPVRHDRVVGFVAGADAALCLIELSSESYRLSSPNKLFEALAANVPPLCTDLPEARSLLGDSFDQWFVKNPATDLTAAVQGITSAVVADFREGWPGLSTWAHEVAGLQAECARLVGRKR